MQILAEVLSNCAKVQRDPASGLRDRYAWHLWGQGCLLARRLAEAGAAVITMDSNTPKTETSIITISEQRGGIE